MRLFEAMPPMEASFTRLRARGAFVVSSSFSRNAAAAAGGGWKVGVTTIASERGEECVLRRPQSWSKAAITVTTSGGKVVRQRWSSDAEGGEYVSFDTTAGETYTLHG